MMNQHQTYDDLAAACLNQKQYSKVEVRHLVIWEHRNRNHHNDKAKEIRNLNKKRDSVCNSEGIKSSICDSE